MVFVLTETDTMIGINGFQTHFIGLGLCLCQCERIIKVHLGPIYIKCHGQPCDNSVMMLAILFSLKTMVSLESGLQSHSGATPLVSMTAVSQSFHSISSDLQYNRALTLNESERESELFSLIFVASQCEH